MTPKRAKIDNLGYVCEIYHNDFNPILINYMNLYSVEYHKKYMIYRSAITRANILSIHWFIGETSYYPPDRVIVIFLN